MERKCVGCLIDISDKGPRAQTCSPRCRTRRVRGQFRRHDEVRLCAGCGIDISHLSSQAVVCSTRCGGRMRTGRFYPYNAVRVCSNTRCGKNISHMRAHAVSCSQYCRDETIRHRNRQIAWDHLLKNPCPCGQNDPRALEFDHRDPSTKVAGVAVLVQRLAPVDVLLAEIAKCDVRCASCHNIRTYEQFGYWVGEFP